MMIKYLTERQITEINYRLIEKFSPKEEKAVRDIEALNMIVNLPEQYVFGTELYPTIHGKAAIIFIQLVLKHVFANGNKRTATFVLIKFLKINGYEFQKDFKELEDLSIYVAVHGNKDETFKYVLDFLKLYALSVES